MSYKTEEAFLENDKFWLGLAKYVSAKSKDPSTKVGAVIIRPDNSLCSIGYNGFPQKMEDRLEYLTNREEKLSRTVHAEINAKDFAHEQVRGYTLYTWPFMSCDRCFVQLAQCGIVRFVSPKATPEQLERWGAAFERVRKYATEMGISLAEIDF